MPKKFLVLNPFGIGDVLFTTPLVSHLRKTYPDAFIGYLANRRASPIVESNPKINRIYIYERDEFKKNLISSWVKFFWQIKREKFDVIFDFSLNASLGFFSLACGIKRRIGYDYRGRGKYLTDKIFLQGYEGQHMVDYYLELLKFLDISTKQLISEGPTLEIFIDEKLKQWARDWIKAKKIDTSRPIIAVLPGGGASWGKESIHKRWPASQYGALVDKIIAKSKATIILMGDQNDQCLSQELIRQCSYPVYDAVGETTLLQMAALLQQCSFAIVNDGGPLHVAVAAGIRTVSIFGPVDPVVYGPYPLSKHIVIQKGLACQPCYRNFRKAYCDHLGCLTQLGNEEVYRKVEKLL